MDVKSNCLDDRRQPPPKNITKNVKECLHPEQLTHFQALMLDIRNNFIIKPKYNKEIGKPRNMVPDLPSHIDPIFTTFGIPRTSNINAADIIHGQYVNYLNIDWKNIVAPGEQINRNYKTPFSKFTSFGKQSNADFQGNRARNLIHRFQEQNNIEKNDIKLKKVNYTYQNIVIDKPFYPSTSIYEILRGIPLNDKELQIQKSISHTNKIRLLIKKRKNEIQFFELINYFALIDENSSRKVSLKIFYETLKKRHIPLNTYLFDVLLKELNLTENDSVYYMEALNLLNRRCEFPMMPKKLSDSVELQNYKTTYQETMQS